MHTPRTPTPPPTRKKSLWEVSFNSSHSKKVFPFPSACLLATCNSAQPGLWSATGKVVPSSLSDPQKTRRQLSLALQSALFTSASACDIHCAPLHAPPPQFAPVNAGMQTLAHTCVWEDLNPGPLEARELRSHGAALAGASLIREAPTPATAAGPGEPGAPPTRASVTCRLFIFLKSPKMSRLDVGRCVPTAPARTMAWSLGAQAARRLRLSHTAAEQRQAPPTSPHPRSHVTRVSGGLLGIVVS